MTVHLVMIPYFIYICICMCILHRSQNLEDMGMMLLGILVPICYQAFCMRYATYMQGQPCRYYVIFDFGFEMKFCNLSLK